MTQNEMAATCRLVKEIRRRDYQDLFASRRLPEDLPVERPGLHVQPPIERQQRGIRQPEGLIIHEQLDDLAVREVDDGLALLREAVRSFSVDDRLRLIKPVD